MSVHLAPAQVEGIALESENGLWGPNMTRQVYTTEPALLDDRGRRIGWQMFAQEYPGPLGVSVFHVWMQPTRAGKHYGPGGSSYCPPEKLMSPDQATIEMGRLMRQALRRYRKVFAPKAPPVTFEPYDVLQVSRDGGKTWLDFSTLRDRADFENAVRIVDTYGRCSGFSGVFRVRKGSPLSTGPDVKYTKGMFIPMMPA